MSKRYQEAADKQMTGGHASRVSTVLPDNQTVNFSEKVPGQNESELTLVHVPREASQDSAQGSRVEKVHGTEQEAVEELVMEHGGSLDGALWTQRETDSFECDTWQV